MKRHDRIIKHLKVIPILLLISCTNAEGQGNLIKPENTQANEVVKKVISEEIVKTLTIDFTGDNQLDYICTVQNNDNGDLLEYWIDHQGSIIKKKHKWAADYDELWFVNLDSDPELEYYSVYGYSDGIDYAFYDQDIKNKNDKLLFYINPVITESLQENKIYWGYPWDTKDLYIKSENGVIKILVSIDHDIELNGENEHPANQSVLPVIFFNGISSQPDVTVEEIRNIKWFSIVDLKGKITK